MKKHLLVLLIMLFASTSAVAQWDLVNEQSSLNFVSVKKSKIAEVHSFKTLTGAIKKSGSVNISIDLSSVDTNIPVRDERMKEMLFDVEQFLYAHLDGKVDLEKFNTLEVGDSYIENVSLKLSLHGISHEVKSDMQVTKLSDNRILASSIKPVIINASDYKLSNGISLLRTIAKLSSISTAVPVTYSLVFQR